MRFSEYKEKFTHKAKAAGYSDEDISYYLEYAERLSKSDVPIIYNASHLAALTGYNTDYLRRAVIHTSYFYRSFYIFKKNGKKRQITEPLPSLKEIQLWINDNILSKIKPSKFAKAYIKNKNILDNVRYHRGKKYVLNLDLKDFFPTISKQTVELFFNDLGYSKSLSDLLAGLCCYNGGLAQGAPSSPSLSNHILFKFDDELGEFAVENELRYTRYADDITFSFNRDISVSFVEDKVKELLGNVKYSNLLINKSKTQLLTQDKRQVITGIVVNEVIQTPISYRKKIRQEIYFIKKFGLENHLMKISEERPSYLYHLLGKINHVISINPHDEEIKSYADIVKNLIKL